jgi:hypothetical protein
MKLVATLVEKNMEKGRLFSNLYLKEEIVPKQFSIFPAKNGSSVHRALRSSNL